MEKVEWWKDAPKMTVRFPGPETERIKKLDDKFLLTSTKLKITDAWTGKDVMLAVAEGRGSALKDVDGNVFIDMISGVATAPIGHCHPKVVAVIKQQSDKLINFVGQDFYNEPQVDLAKKLVEISPRTAPRKVFFSNSGAESVECALKLSKLHSKRSRLLSFIGGFHGRTFGTLSIGGSRPVHFRGLSPFVPGAQITHIPYCYCYRCRYKLEYPSCNLWCADYIKEVLFNTVLPAEDVSALIGEPIQGEGGYIVPQEGFFPKLRRICDEFGIIMIADEVQTGLGRTGRMFGMDNWGIESDVTCLAKGIASGIPMGATIAKSELDFEHEGSHSNTFGGNPIACRAAIATMEVIVKDDLVSNAAKLGKHALRRIKEIMANQSLIGDVRGKGLMIGVEIVKDQKRKTPAPEIVDYVIMESLKRGIVLLPCGASTIRILPSLNITVELMDKAIDIFEESLRAVQRNASFH